MLQLIQIKCNLYMIQIGDFSLWATSRENLFFRHKTKLSDTEASLRALDFEKETRCYTMVVNNNGAKQANVHTRQVCTKKQIFSQHSS